MAGTKISATTQGLIPLNTLSIHTLSLISLKKIAIKRMAKKDGNAAPKAEKKAPDFPLNLYPTYKAVFIANTPGNG